MAEAGGVRGLLTFQACTEFGWFVVAPWRGQPIPPIAANWSPAALWRGPLINGIFGLGTGLMLQLLQGLFRGRR